MQAKRHFTGLIATLLAMVSLTMFVGPTWAATEKILHRFGKNKDGIGPTALIFDSHGNLYGTTEFGGASNEGTVFKLTPKAGGNWTEKILHSFAFNNSPGSFEINGLIMDGGGNLYGTTLRGGRGSCFHGGCGTVFELIPKSGGGWTERILHSFNGKDGMYPAAGVTLDASGNLHGTTEWGGASNQGTVFQLTPKVGGGWEEKVLHSFRNDGKDGNVPVASLIFVAGTLFGTTQFGGVDGEGTVFELTPKGNGEWEEKVLHSFNPFGTDGYNPLASLVPDADGNLYGTTEFGGSGSCSSDKGNLGCGTVFELQPKADGEWAEKILYSFKNDGKDGNYPLGGLAFDHDGNLYGVTDIGGIQNAGTVFKLTRASDGVWKESIVYAFRFGEDGAYPDASVILDGDGNVYGTTTGGGGNYAGTVFEIIP